MIAHARKRAKRLRLALVPKRERNGRLQRPANREREAEADVLSIALGQPHRRFMANPRDELLGSALGRLRRSEAITEAMYDAGETFAAIARRYMRDVEGINPHVKGCDLSGSRGPGCGAGPDEDDITRTRRDWSDVTSALRDTREGRECLEALIVVCVLDEDPVPALHGHVLLGLNALRRLWA